jgi:hypothetical protein
MRKNVLAVAILASCATVASTAMAADLGENTKLGGKAYIDLTNIDYTSDGTKSAPSGTGADLKRFYVSIDHKFDDMWSANVTTDVTYDSAVKATQVYIKKAYVQAKFSDAFILRAGSADLPWVPFEEDQYGYRWVENIQIDHLKFGTSADWGLHAKGTFGGMVSYAASVVNGNGYKNPSRAKSMDVEGRLSAEPIKGLTVAVGFYNGKLGKETETTSALHTAQRVDALIGYVSKTFRLGASYFDAKNWGQVLSASTDKADGFSVWGSYNFTDKMSVFTRYDDANPSKTLNPSMKAKYFNVGLGYAPRKNVDFALVYKEDKVENGTWGTSNGSIGGESLGKYQEIGIWTQVKF